MPIRPLDSDNYFLTGVLDPADIGVVAQLAAQGKLLGASGLIIPHQMVNGYSSAVRERIGQVLQLLPKVFVLDDLSVEWAPHLGLRAEKGGDLNWLLEGSRKLVAQVASTVGAAHNLAKAGKKMVLVVVHESSGWAKWTETGGADKSHLPLYRWAKEMNMLEAVRTNVSEKWGKDEEHLLAPGRCLIEIERAQVALDVMKREKTGMDGDSDIRDRIDAVFGTTKAPPRGELRRLNEGEVLDPATHYDEYYYGVGGKGIEFPKPDGSWEVYRGTAHYWEGNLSVARILRQIGLRGRLLDVGTGAGDFVGRSIQAGFDAWGVDISDSAHEHSQPIVRKRLKVFDVTVQSGFDKKFNVITAFDFWEHIFEQDVDKLVESVGRMLEKGGIHVAVICTRGQDEQDQVFEPGVRVSRKNGWVLVSGHVNIRAWAHWARRFRDAGFRLRHDLMNLFQVRRMENMGLRGCESWSSRNLLIVEKRK